MAERSITDREGPARRKSRWPWRLRGSSPASDPGVIRQESEVEDDRGDEVVTGGSGPNSAAAMCKTRCRNHRTSDRSVQAKRHSEEDDRNRQPLRRAQYRSLAGLLPITAGGSPY